MSAFDFARNVIHPPNNDLLVPNQSLFEGGDLPLDYTFEGVVGFSVEELLRGTQGRLQADHYNRLWGPFHILFILTSTLGVMANFVLLIVFAKYRELRTARNLFIVNLAVGNTVISFSLIPIVYLPKTKKLWIYSDLACKLCIPFTRMNVYCSTFSIMAIAIDRYYAVKKTVRSANSNSEMARCFAVCVLIWAASILLETPDIIYHATVPLSINIPELEKRYNMVFTGVPENLSTYSLGKVCRYSPPNALLKTMICIQILLLLPLPVVSVAIYNFKLHDFLRKNRMKRARISRITKMRESSDRSASTSTRADGSQSRVSVILVLMVLCVAGVWSPFHVMTILVDFYRREIQESLYFDALDSTFQLLGYVSLIINPVLYGYFNYNFRWAILRLLACLQIPESVSMMQMTRLIDKTPNRRSTNNAIRPQSPDSSSDSPPGVDTALLSGNIDFDPVNDEIL